MAATWWLIENDDGSYRQVVTDGDNPADCGEPGVAHKMKRRGDLTMETPDVATGKWTADMDAVRIPLLQKVDNNRQLYQDALVSPGDGKKLVYAQKKAEHQDYYKNGADPQNAERFPAAYAQIAICGGTLAETMAGFKAGADASNEKLYRLDAMAMRAKRGIEAANTVQAAEAAAAVDWTTA